MLGSSSMEDPSGYQETKAPWGGTRNTTSLFAPQRGGLERILACGAGVAAMCALGATLCALVATAWVDTWEPLWLSNPQDLSPFVATGYTGFAAGTIEKVSLLGERNSKSKSSTPLGFASSDTTLSSDASLTKTDDPSPAAINKDSPNEPGMASRDGNTSADSDEDSWLSWADQFFSRNSSTVVGNVSDIVSYRYAISGKSAELDKTDQAFGNKRVDGRNQGEMPRKNQTAENAVVTDKGSTSPDVPPGKSSHPDDDDEDMTDYRYIYLDDQDEETAAQGHQDYPPGYQQSQFQYRRLQATQGDWPRTRRPYVTVFFKTGLWRTCPLYLHGNLQPNFVLPGLPCTSLGYFSWMPLTSDALQLRGPIEFTPEFLNKLRYATPFLLLGAVVALASIVVAIASPCCQMDRALLCSSLHILSGLSLGCGLVIFVSVLHGEFHEPLLAATRLRTAGGNFWDPPIHPNTVLPLSGPSFRYGWAFYAAVAAFMNAELAAALYIILHARTFGVQLRKLGVVQRRLLTNDREYDYELLPFDTSFDTPLHGKSPSKRSAIVGAASGIVGVRRPLKDFHHSQVLQPDQLTTCSQSSRLTLVQESIPSVSVPISPITGTTTIVQDSCWPMPDMRKPPSLQSFRGGQQQIATPNSDRGGSSEHQLGNYDPDILPFATPLPKPPSDFRDQSPGSPTAITDSNSHTTAVQIEVTTMEQPKQPLASFHNTHHFHSHTLKPNKPNSQGLVSAHNSKDPCTCHMQYRSLPRHHHYLTLKPQSQHLLRSWVDSAGLETESDSSSASTSFMSNSVSHPIRPQPPNHSQPAPPRRKSVSINRYTTIEVFDTQPSHS